MSPEERQSLDDEIRDPLRPARGVVWGLLLGCLLWLLAACAGLAAARGLL